MGHITTTPNQTDSVHTPILREGKLLLCEMLMIPFVHHQQVEDGIDTDSWLKQHRLKCSSFISNTRGCLKELLTLHIPGFTPWFWLCCSSLYLSVLGGFFFFVFVLRLESSVACFSGLPLRFSLTFLLDIGYLSQMCLSYSYNLCIKLFGCPNFWLVAYLRMVISEKRRVY